MCIEGICVQLKSWIVSLLNLPLPIISVAVSHLIASINAPSWATRATTRNNYHKSLAKSNSNPGTNSY